MVTRPTQWSDLSGEPIIGEEAISVVVYFHPLIDEPVKLDASKKEVEDIGGTDEFVLLEVMGDTSRIQRLLTVEEFEKLFASDASEVLASAEKFNGRSRAGGGTAKAPSVDYTDLDYIGVRHRGRLTDKEKELVASNFERAQANRRRMGQPEIDLTDKAEVAKYGLEDLATA